MTDSKTEDVREALIVPPGQPFQLASRNPDAKPLFRDKDGAEESCKEDAKAIDRLQDELYAEGRRALLVVLQGIDTAGKSGTIKSVFAETGPMGVSVTAFGKPSEAELARDYLWRINAALPAKGTIGIFDRSHYEDVLVVRVRELAPREDIERRYAQINEFERRLVENGVVILKFMLHISFEEQGKRLRARLEDPCKRWKFNPADLDDRARWDQYQAAYDIALERCSTPHAPWYVVPSDSKTRRNALIARIVRRTLEDMAPEPPDPGFKLEDYPIR
jgi:PPK2 family polyphosphate:nucleotide phosphotransferase